MTTTAIATADQALPTTRRRAGILIAAATVLTVLPLAPAMAASAPGPSSTPQPTVTATLIPCGPWELGSSAQPHPEPPRCPPPPPRRPCDERPDDPGPRDPGREPGVDGELHPDPEGKGRPGMPEPEDDSPGADGAVDDLVAVDECHVVETPPPFTG